MVVIAALYKFASFQDPGSLTAPLRSVAEAVGVRGILLLAREGINGTIAGDRAGIDAVLAHIRGLPGCTDLDWKESASETMPFSRLKVREKDEIVTLGQPGIDPARNAGQYVDPADWNALISAPDVAVIDTRNDYETTIGTFRGAVDPATLSFRDFPEWWLANAERFSGKRIAMFCTGGIRCEKSTSYLKSQGVEEVYHLRGGILKYLEQVPEAESLWEGSCFVFDERVSVGHGLRPGEHTLCRACRRPLEPSDRTRPEFEAGVACHQCATETSEADKGRFRERQKQIALSAARGEQHMKRGA